VDGGAGGAGDDADDRGVERNRPPAFWCKKPFGLQFFFQLFERLEQSSAAGRPRDIADELKTSAGRPDRGTPSHLDALSVDDKTARSPGGRAIHDAIDDGVFPLVFETEIDMPARRRFGIRHFPFHPDLRGGCLDRSLEPPIELGDRVDRNAPLSSHE
jgi:hypothetical protein